MTQAAVVTGNRVEYRVCPDRAIPITVEVPPRAVCFFYHPNAPGRRLQMDANDRGLLRFHARALEGAEATEFHLECHAEDGQIELYVVALIADLRLTEPVVAAQSSLLPTVEGEVRPALQGHPLALSNIELVSKGYPPRPDPSQAPAQYARWLKIVSESYTQINARRVAHPEYGELIRGPFVESFETGQDRGPLERHPTRGLVANQPSTHWSGAYYTHPIKQFAYILADWTVPLVFDGFHGPGLSAMVEWIGLDNVGEDIYQAGTGSECLTAQSFQVTTYFLWMETLPWNWWEIPNFPVSPGDEIRVDIFALDRCRANCSGTDQERGLAAKDHCVCFQVCNATSGACFTGTYPAVAESHYGLTGTGYSCHTAEFILERPKINGSLVPMAQFAQPASMTGCAYGDQQYGEFNLFPLGPANEAPPFDGQLTYLNMVDPSNPYSVCASAIPDPLNGADAQAILFQRSIDEDPGGIDA